MHLKNPSVSPGQQRLRLKLVLAALAAVSLGMACSKKAPQAAETTPPPPPPPAESSTTSATPATATPAPVAGADASTPPVVPAPPAAAPTAEAAAPATGDPLAKITFSLDDIGADGLRGRADGRVAVSYEFCVPKEDSVYDEVRALDRSVQIHPNSRGRSGCGPDKALCIGNTNQANWRQVLQALAAKDYVTEINATTFE